MKKIIGYAKKNWKYILIAVIAFTFGVASGPSADDLATANKAVDDVKAELQQEKETNAALTEENNKLISRNKLLQAKVDEAAEEKRLAVETAKKEAEEKAKAEAEAAAAKAKTEAEAAVAKAKAEAEAAAKAKAETELAAANNSSPSTSTGSSGSSSYSSHSTSTGSSGSSSSSAPSASTGSTVYKTPYGKRYHLDPGCGGKNSTATTKDNAISVGLTPCQKCAY